LNLDAFPGNNTAMGFNALDANSSGSSNTAFGYSSLTKNTTGTSNTAVGNNSLTNNKTGTSNTGIGFSANVSIATLTYATAIGYNALVNASNKVRIGNTSVTVIEGQVPFTFPSDARFKNNIQSNVPGLNFITRLTPVTYYLNDQKLAAFIKSGVIDNNFIQPAAYNSEKKLHSGFLAQNVESTANAINYNFDGVNAPTNNTGYYSLSYSQFVMPLVKSIQEQQLVIDQLTTMLAQSKEEITFSKQAQIIDAQNYTLLHQQLQLKKMSEQLKELQQAAKTLLEKSGVLIK